MTILNSQISILILNLNGLNAPIKDTDTQTELKSQNTLALCIQIHLVSKDRQRLKRKGWRKTHQSNGEERKTKQTNKKKTGVVTFVSDKIDYNSNQDKKKQRTLHNDKRINATIKVNDHKYICTQYRGTQIYKTSFQ